MSKALVINGADFSANKLATIVITEPVPCTGISLNQSSASLVAPGTVTLTATPTPSNTTDSVVWTSSNNSVATVEDGVVTGVSSGSATITATCGSYSASCTIAVTVYYTTPVYGYINAQAARIDYQSAYNYKSGGTFNDPFLRKVSSGQTVKVRQVGSGVSGLYLYVYVYATGTFSDKCQASGDDYVLTQAMLDMESSSAYGILTSSSLLATKNGYMATWDNTKDYTADQDCYVAFWFNINGSSDISGQLSAIANALSISID